MFFTDRVAALREMGRVAGEGAVIVQVPVELPLADVVTNDVRKRITDQCGQALLPFTEPSGAVAAPIEVHLIVASPHTTAGH